MRAALLVCAISGAAAFAQALPVAPVPADPLELVTGTTRVPESPDQRAALVTLLEKTMENHNLHLRGGSPYSLSVAFTATDSTLYPGGAGVLKEDWVSGDHWRWTASFGNYSQLQLSSNGAVYGQNPNPLPMRLRTLREAVFAPVQAMPRRATIRAADEVWNGVQLTCILLSAGWNEQTAANGRQWYETEYCIDPSTATLRIFSEAPGIYIVYDYANALKFHGRTLPGRITVQENGREAIDAQLTSIADADPANLSLFIPTAQMMAQGAAPVMGPVERFPMPVVSNLTGNQIQPVIVHVTLDPHGKVLEYEALQTGPLTAKVVDLVRQRNFAASPAPAGSSPVLREAYVNVRCGPAQALQGSLVH